MLASLGAVYSVYTKPIFLAYAVDKHGHRDLNWVQKARKKPEKSDYGGYAKSRNIRRILCHMKF